MGDVIIMTWAINNISSEPWYHEPTINEKIESLEKGIAYIKGRRANNTLSVPTREKNCKIEAATRFVLVKLCVDIEEYGKAKRELYAIQDLRGTYEGYEKDFELSNAFLSKIETLLKIRESISKVLVVVKQIDEEGPEGKSGEA